MIFDSFQWYLIIINITSFVLFSIDFRMYISSGSGIKPAFLCDFVTTIGGSLGTCVAFLIWDRKLDKQNLTWRIFAISILIIQVVICAAIYGPHKREILEWITTFYFTNKLLCCYLLFANIITFVLFAIDKFKAVRGLWRIRELVLLGFIFLGGTVGGLIGMWTFNHKTKSPQFSFGMPMMLIAQIILLLYILI